MTTQSTTIDDLPAVSNAQPDHVIPAMREGQTVKLTVQKIATLIVALVSDSAPATLDTLNELAAALGDDPNFAATTAAALANRLRIDTSQSLTALQQDRGRANLAVPGRNLIINGQGRINQRAYVSETNTAGANQFTFDRWFVNASGQSLAFTGDGSRRVMTAPAAGVSQVIEGNAILGGTYVLNWTGTAVAFVNGTFRAKGETFTLTANTTVTVRFQSGTFTDVQLELALLPTPYERLAFAQELALCQRYYEKSYNLADPPGTITTSGQARTISVTSGANGTRVPISFKVSKMSSPTVTLFSPVNGAAGFILDDVATANRTATVDSAGISGAYAANAVTTTASATHSVHWVAEAELTS